MMKAIILAAGYATRLMPLTQYTPKPLLQIGDSRIIEHLIHKLEVLPDINEIFVVTNDRFYSVFMFWLNEFETDIPIQIINDNTTSNEDRLGPIGDIDFVIKQTELDDDLLVLAGDNLFDSDMQDMYEQFLSKDINMLAVYDVGSREKAANRFGVVITDEYGKMIDFEEKPAKPKSTLAASVIYMIRKQDLPKITDFISSESVQAEAGIFIKYLGQNTPVYVHTLQGRWFDIGTPDDYEKVKHGF